MAQFWVPFDTAAISFRAVPLKAWAADSEIWFLIKLRVFLPPHPSSSPARALRSKCEVQAPLLMDSVLPRI